MVRLISSRMNIRASPGNPITKVKVYDRSNCAH